MKINNLAYDEDEDPTAFEILMYSGNKRFFLIDPPLVEKESDSLISRSHLSFIFTCDSETNKDHWSAHASSHPHPHR
jgi:hypothetical protein